MMKLLLGLLLAGWTAAAVAAPAGPIQYPAIPNCTDTTGNHLNYTTTTGVFVCGTSVGGASQIITTLTANNATWTVNAATKYVTIYICGGGGSGAGGTVYASPFTGPGGGSGGGAGCMQYGPVPASVMPSPLTLKYLQGSAGPVAGGTSGNPGAAGASLAIEDRTTFSFTLECNGGGGGGVGVVSVGAAGGGSGSCGAQGPQASSAGNGSGASGGSTDGWAGYHGVGGAFQATLSINATAGGVGVGGGSGGSNDLGGATAGSGGSGGGSGGGVVTGTGNTGGDSGVSLFNFNSTGTLAAGPNGVCGGYIGGSGGAGGGGNGSGNGQPGGNGVCGGGGGGGGASVTGNTGGTGGSGAAPFVTIVEQ